MTILLFVQDGFSNPVDAEEGVGEETPALGDEVPPEEYGYEEDEQEEY